MFSFALHIVHTCVTPLDDSNQAVAFAKQGGQHFLLELVLMFAGSPHMGGFSVAFVQSNTLKATLLGTPVQLLVNTTW